MKIVNSYGNYRFVLTLMQLHVKISYLFISIDHN